jgi:hypothetical protein
MGGQFYKMCGIYIILIQYVGAFTLMALADIFVLDHVQSFDGEPLHNLYTYDSGGTGTAVDLINAFRDDMLPLILQLQCAQIRTDTIKAYSLGNLGDLDEQTVDETGANVGLQMLPVFNAVNFSLKPTSRAVRSGSKRIAGIPETVQVDGTITDATYLTAMEALRIAMSNPISDDDLVFFDPVIVKRVKYAVPDSDPVRYAYRYPEAGDTLVTATIRAVVLNRKVSHQVSRGN